MKKIIALVLALVMCLAFGSTLAETTAGTTVDWLGTVNGSVYENAVAGFGCNLEGWTYATQEEIIATQELTKEQLTEDLAKAMEEAQSVTVMMATSADQMKNVNLAIQDVSEYISIYESIGMDGLLTLIKGQMETAYAAQGMKDVVCDIIQVDISGKSFYAMQVSCTYMGVPVYQKQLADVKGNNMIMLTVTTYFSDGCDEVLANFYTVE